MFSRVTKHGRNVFGLGWRRDPLAGLHDEFQFSVSPHLLALARSTPKIDLTTEPFYFDAYDQGRSGSCQSHAGGGLEQFTRRKLGEKPDEKPSFQQLYYDIRAREGNIGSDSGGSLRDTLRCMVTNGVASDAEWPYDSTTEADPATGLFPAGCHAVTKPPPAVYAAAKQHVVTQDARVRQSVLQLKACMLQGYPFMFGFIVLSSMFDPATGDPVIDLPMPKSGDQEDGGHAVDGVGADDTRVMPDGSVGAFKIRNSWGISVQQRGHFWMPYRYMESAELCSDFWTIRHLLT